MEALLIVIRQENSKIEVSLMSACQLLLIHNVNLMNL